ncbi:MULTISPECIES: hypothetical protein [unclassified Burkholderia]|uniref:hypothetical protein n=1 Tax=unclassified Burkholderia TaxID=2613784 RepID=UPI00141F3BFD|nr:MULTISPECIES: hypothetical protein [unclassified Burkholderia]NIE56313.1 hypothetical protein [Burkholderia sp. Ap-955]NIF08318.1 hypothetical protein [Burkholderia sp. Ax-1735]NIG00972.1 hypothetical protein [Burkholderia sp. Tr-849]
MKRNGIVGLLIAALVSPVAAQSGFVLTGKTTSRVTAKVVRVPVLTVTDGNGGWFERGLEMQQFGGWDTPYEATAQLRVTATLRDFQVRLDEPLQIRNQTRPAQVFRRPTVNFGAEGGAPKPLAVGQSMAFQNPAPTVPGGDSVGTYVLSVAAYPPEGDFHSTAGQYSGVLSLTFEPVVKAP